MSTLRSARPDGRRELERKLHVALVTETYPPEINGVAVTLRHLVAGLRQRGHALHVIRPRQSDGDTPRDEPGYRETLVRGVAIPRYEAVKLGLTSRAALLALWRRDRPDVVHIVTEGPLGWVATDVARRLGIPVTSDFHTNFHGYARHYGLRWLERPVLAYLRHLHNKAACTMVPTAELAQDLASHGFARIKVVARGVDTRLFNPMRRDYALRRAWGAGPDDPVVLFVSRIAPEKNLPLLMRTYAAMRAVDPRARLVVVGDGPEMRRLRARHPEAVYTGMQTGTALASHYASADVFLFPSTTETFGNVTLEALASGLAVLAYDYAAARLHIRSGDNGVTARFDDAEEFVRLATALVLSPARATQMGHRAHQTALRIDWDEVIGDFEDALLAQAP